MTHHVEQRQMLPRPDNLLQLSPLLLRRVNPRRVLRTHVQQHYTPLGRLFNVLLHALKVQADGVLVEVAVPHDLETGLLSDGQVGAPGGVGKVDGLGAWVVVREKGGSYAEGTGARDGLGDC